MLNDPNAFLMILVVGVFAASFVSGAIGFADALILNAFWLHIMAPATAIPLVVTCAIFMHIVPLYKLRSQLDYSKFSRFLLPGILGIPIGVWALNVISPDRFKIAIAVLLITYGAWAFLRPGTKIEKAGGIVADGAVGIFGGFLGGFAGLSGLAPTLWTGIRGWPKSTQRGVFQPFVLSMHILTIASFIYAGWITKQTLNHLLWCLPFIVLGSWLGVKTYPFLDEKLFRKIVLALIVASGVSLLL